MERLASQRERYQFSESLVIYQLVALEHSKSWLRLLEIAVFSTALRTFQIDAFYETLMDYERDYSDELPKAKALKIIAKHGIRPCRNMFSFQYKGCLKSEIDCVIVLFQSLMEFVKCGGWTKTNNKEGLTFILAILNISDAGSWRCMLLYVLLIIQNAFKTYDTRRICINRLLFLSAPKQQQQSWTLDLLHNLFEAVVYSQLSEIFAWPRNLHRFDSNNGGLLHSDTKHLQISFQSMADILSQTVDLRKSFKTSPLSDEIIVHVLNQMNREIAIRLKLLFRRHHRLDDTPIGAIDVDYQECCFLIQKPL
jgi:hypothetical protein